MVVPTVPGRRMKWTALEFRNKPSFGIIDLSYITFSASVKVHRLSNTYMLMLIVLLS